MFQIVLSLFIGILVGWNFHLFYINLEPKAIFKNSNIITPIEPKIEEEKQKIILVKSTIREIPSQKEISKQPPPIEETNSSTQSPFEEVLHKDDFSEAMAFYMEANEEELKDYKLMIKVYFYDRVDKFPKKTIKEMLYYIDIEPHSEEIQLYLANLYIKKEKFKQAISLLSNLHNNDDDEKYTISLAELYFNISDYEKAEKLLQEIQPDSEYHAKAIQTLQKIERNKKEAKQYTHKIPLNRVGSQYSINLTINNTPLTLLLDTGASYTFVDDEKIPSITIEKEILLNTAGGDIIAQLAQADTLTIQDIELNNFKVTTAPFKRDDADGLLGMNFFEKFDFKIDQEKKLLYLSLKEQ